MFDSIIFDLDGTFWHSTGQICEAWNVVLKRHAEIKRPPVTINELGECMGLPMYDIAAKLFPLESKEVQTAIMDELCAYENEYLSEHGARLFDGLENVLSLLSKIGDFLNKDMEIYSFKNKDEAQELLNNSRIQIDEIDNELFKLICKRTSLAKDIVLAKSYLEMPIYDKAREERIFDKSHRLADEKDLDVDIVEQIMNMLTILSKNEQNKILRRIENGKY